MRNEPENDVDLTERAMSQLTLVDGTRVSGTLEIKLFSDVFENEENNDEDDSPPLLHVVSVPNLLPVVDPEVAQNVSVAEPGETGNAGANGILLYAHELSLRF